MRCNHLKRSFDEIQVYAGIAERTGTQLDRGGVRGRPGLCRSLTELGAKARRMGDGFYYLASASWPPDTKAVDLNRAW